MEKNITITLSEEELRDICAGLSMWVSKKNSPSNWKHREERLIEARKAYRNQKQLDAICLASNGGKLELLSGEAGRLRKIINHMESHQEAVRARVERILQLREVLQGYLPDDVPQEQCDC